MENGTHHLVEKVQELSDLELACLLCFVADQHCCIIETDSDDLNALEKEIGLICASTFDLRSVAVHCGSTTTCEEFGQAILVGDDVSLASSPTVTGDDGHDYLSPAGKAQKKPLMKSQKTPKEKSEGSIANIIIATGLNECPEQVQVQALELIRGRRIFSRKEVHVAPKNLLLISLQQHGSQRHHPLLNDHVFLSHSHDSLEHMPHGQSRRDMFDNNVSDSGSMASVIYSPPATPGEMETRRSSKGGPFITRDDINALTTLSSAVSMSPDIKAYIHDVIIYLRNHRAIAGGASAMATRHLNLLSRILAPLHSLGFITPSLVALAVHKVYPHRLVLMAPEQERSLQWGSSLEAVTELLRRVTVEDIIEEVLSSVETPL